MTNPHHPTGPSLDCVEFVVPQTTTVARIHQLNAMVWGEYVQDSAYLGRFVGRRTDDTIELQYVHFDVESGQHSQGDAAGLIEFTAAGAGAGAGADADAAAPVLRLTLDAFGDEFSRQVEFLPAGSAALGTEQFDALLAANAAHFDGEGEGMIDGTEFVLESSTASVVNHQSPSRFFFHEAGGILFAEYEGDTVTFGHTVGIREGNVLHEWFVHEFKVTGEAMVGESTSRIEMRADGQLELKEDFVLNGAPGYSVCVEV